MKWTENRKSSIRDDILGILREKRTLTREEIVAKVREKRAASPKSIQKQMSNLLKAGIIVSKGEKEKKKYELPEIHPSKEKLTEESVKEDLRVLTQSEIEALRSVVHGIAPLLIDAGEELELYDLLGRVHDLDKLVASHDLPDSYLTIARLCTDFFRRYPSTFKLETNLLSTNPFRAKVFVKDSLALLFVRYGFDDKEINQLQYFRDKQDYQTRIVIESVKKQNEIIERIDKVLRDYPDLRYVARIFALKKASPRWIFGYEFEEDLRRINTVLQKSDLKLEVESGDRLVTRLITERTREQDGKLKESIEDLDVLLEEFEKFFHHPYYAIMPNPFNNEPELWRYYVDSFADTYYAWVCSFKGRFKEVEEGLDFHGLMKLWTEFCRIVSEYGRFAQSFSQFASTKEEAANVSDDIKRQFNEDFLEEFNHGLLRRTEEYAIKFERVSGLKVPNRKIGHVKPIIMPKLEMK